MGFWHRLNQVHGIDRVIPDRHRNTSRLSNYHRIARHVCDSYQYIARHCEVVFLVFATKPLQAGDSKSSQTVDTFKVYERLAIEIHKLGTPVAFAPQDIR